MCIFCMNVQRDSVSLGRLELMLEFEWQWNWNTQWVTLIPLSSVLWKLSCVFIKVNHRPYSMKCMHCIANAVSDIGTSIHWDFSKNIAFNEIIMMTWANDFEHSQHSFGKLKLHHHFRIMDAIDLFIQVKNCKKCCIWFCDDFWNEKKKHQ